MTALQDFRDDITNIYGYMLQGFSAFLFWRKSLLELVQNSTPNNTFYFGNTNPNNVDAQYQYRRTYRELLDDCAESGATSIIHKRSTIVLLVSSWEDQHRDSIAKECGLSHKDDLKSDIFHDLNRYRQAILHAGGLLRDDPKVIPLFRKGDAVNLTMAHMESIFRMVIDELNRMGEKHYGTNPGFTFDRPMRRS